jgi:hypothetical protein
MLNPRIVPTEHFPNSRHDGESNRAQNIIRRMQRARIDLCIEQCISDI